MIQNHPVDSYDKKLNFWEEFPSYKIHPVLGEIWKANKKSNLQNSSKFMWVLSLCYDRKSAMFSQPEIDKWNVACEDLFGDEHFFFKLTEDPSQQKIITFTVGMSLRLAITEFEKSIDTPLGISLRVLESKLLERTEFINLTKYTLDDYEDKGGRQVMKKGTASQLDKMFADTEKINSLIQTAMSALESSTTSSNKGGGQGSLGDTDSEF